MVINRAFEPHPFFSQNQSSYRGVSRNNNSGWQVLVMINGQQNFMGTVDNINLAALIYDMTLIQNKGLEVKTNFIYNKLDIISLMSIG